MSAGQIKKHRYSKNKYCVQLQIDTMGMSQNRPALEGADFQTL
jgi:hypothetical protein